jgi:hypothetical protein
MLSGLRNKCMVLSFRAKRGIFLRFKFKKTKEGEIPRFARNDKALSFPAAFWPRNLAPARTKPRRLKPSPLKGKISEVHELATRHATNHCIWPDISICMVEPRGIVGIPARYEYIHSCHFRSSSMGVVFKALVTSATLA